MPSLPAFRRHIAITGAVVGLFVTASVRASGDETLDWIAELPGVVRQADKSVATGTERVFTARDGQAAFDAVRAGLRQRGWTVDKATAVDMGAAAVSTLRASRDAQRIKVTLNTATGQALLVVTLSGAGEAAPSSARRGSRRDPSGAAEALIGSLLGAAPAAGGEGLSLFDNGVTQTHDCRGRKVAIHGNASRLTFTGDCPSVAANGNDNVIVISGPVAHISAAGSGNTISWSATANSEPPSISDLGRGNRITRSGGDGRR